MSHLSFLKIKYFFVFSLLYIVLCGWTSQIVSLRDFGWNKAKTGEERARVLYNAHSYAVRKGMSVDYTGISVVDIEITKNFKSIPLCESNDFSGVVFNVVNNWRDVDLFTKSNQARPISVSKELLDGTQFGSVAELSKGEKLLAIKDLNLWVDQRVGYNYGHYRKDVLLIKDGKSFNSVIAQYNNNESNPSCFFYVVNNEEIRIENFTLNRMGNSTKRTDCVKIVGFAHVRFNNIEINTPTSDIIHDHIFKVEDCADVSFTDVKVNGTYSKENKFGYAFFMNNVWNTRFIRVDGAADWGVMGNNNMSDTYLYNCHLNRFDIHCYGKNVIMYDCIIDGGDKGWFSGGAGIYGIIKYVRCHFINAYPIYFDSSFKTLVGSDVFMEDCVIDMTAKRNSVFYTRGLNKIINPRRSVSNKELPNIEVYGLTINIPEGMKRAYLFNVEKNVTYPNPVGYLNKVIIKDLVINSENPDYSRFRFCSVPLRLSNPLVVDISDMRADRVLIDFRIASGSNQRVIINNSTLYVDNGYSKGLNFKTINSRLNIVN